MSGIALNTRLTLLYAGILAACAATAQPVVTHNPDSLGVAFNTCDSSTTVSYKIYNTGSSALNYRLLEGAAKPTTYFDTAYVFNPWDNNISVVNLTNFTVVSTIGSGNYPWRGALSPDARELWVSNRDDNQIRVYNTANNFQVATINTSNYPGGIAFTNDGRFAYVACRNANAVDRIDVASRAVVNTITTNISGPRNIRISPDGSVAYVANDNGIAVIDLATDNVIAGDNTRGTCNGIAFTPDGNRVYVSESCCGDGVHVYDAVSHTYTTTIFAGFNQPHGLAVSPDGNYLYVGDQWNGRIVVFDVATNTFLQSMSHPDLSGIWDLAVMPDGRRMIADVAWNNNDIWNIDLETLSVSGSIDVNGNGSWGLATLPGGLGWATQSRKSGAVAPGDSVTINVLLDGTDMISGTYEGFLFIFSDDPSRPVDSIRVAMIINGAPVMQPMDTCALHDTTFVGATDPQTIRFANTGCDTLFVTNITSTQSVFVPEGTSGYALPGDTVDLRIDFTPTAVTAYSGTLTVFSNAGDSTFCLEGVGVAAPVMSVFPDSFYVTLGCSDTLDTTLTIYNTGPPDLAVDTIVRLPAGQNLAFSDGFESGNFSGWTQLGGSYTREVTADDAAAGNYSYRQTGGNFSYYDGISHSFGPTQADFVSFYVMSPPGQSQWNCGVGIGDNNVTSTGGLADFWIDNSSSQFYLYSPGSGTRWTAMTPGQWHRIEFRNIDYTNKTFDYYVDGNLEFAGFRFWDQAMTELTTVHLMGWDPGHVSNYDEFLIGNEADFLTYTPGSGTVPNGDSLVVDVRFIATGRVNGRYDAQLVISSNDPADPEHIVPAVMIVDGQPELSFYSDTCLIFDTTMVSLSTTDSMGFYNGGCDTLFIDSLVFDQTDFVIDTASPYILPYDWGGFIMTFSPTASGLITDTVYIYTNAVDTFVCIQGFAIDAPVVCSFPDSFSVTLSCADTAIQYLKICNQGAGSTPLTGNITYVGEAIFFDNFEDGSISDWVMESGAYTKQATNALAANGSYSLELVGGQGTHLAGVSHTFQQSQPEYISFYLRKDNASAQKGFVVIGNNPVNWSDGICYFWMNGGSFYVNDGNYGSALANVWYFVEFRNINWTAKTYDVYVNNALLRGNTPFRNTALTSVNEVHFYNWTGASNAYLDDILIKQSMISPWLSLSPNTVNIAPGDTDSVAVTFTSTGQLAGQYLDTITIASNDPVTPTVKVPVRLVISGGPEISFQAPGCHYLDSIMVYTANSLSLWVRNDGCDTMDITGITSSLSEYTTVPASAVIPPFDSIKLTITFAPTAVGSFPGTLTFTGNFGDGDTTLCVTGKAFGRPILTHVPDSFNITINSCCDSVSDTLTIYNTGVNDLSFNFRDHYANFDGANDYIRVTNTYPGLEALTAEAWVYPTTTTGLRWIAGNARDCCGNPGGFNLYINGTGLAANVWQQSNAATLGVTAAGIITANEWQHVAMTFNGTQVKLYRNGQLVATSTSVSPTAVMNSSYNFHIGVLAYSAPSFYDYQGRIDEVRLWNTARSDAAIAASFYRPVSRYSAGLIGYWNFDTQNANDLTKYANNGTLFGNTTLPAGGPFTIASWSNISPTSGTIAPGDSAKIGFEFSSCGQLVDSYSQTLYFQSADPLAAVDSVMLGLIINAAPEIGLSDTCLYLDSIMVFTSNTDSVYVRNTGCDTLFVTNVTTGTAEFTPNPTSFFVEPGDSQGIGVAFSPVTVGSFNDVLTIFNNDRDTTVCLSGKSSDKPISCHTPDSFNVTLACSDTLYDTLKICNPGASDLIFTITGNNTMSPATCSPGRVQACCPMGPFNVTFNTINNNSGGGDQGYQNFTGISTQVFQGQTYNISVTTSASWSENLRVWIDYNNDGAFAAGEIVFQTNNVFQTHSGQITIPSGGITTGPRRMRVGSDYYASAAPTGCSTMQYGQYEDYTVLIFTGTDVAGITDTVAPGDTSYVPIRFISTGLLIGTYRDTIIIQTNDPLNPVDSVPTLVNVVGAPTVTVQDSCLYLDSIMEFNSFSAGVYVGNTGCDTLWVTNVTTGTGIYSDDQGGFYVLPGDSQLVTVTFSPVAPGTFNDTLRIYNNDADTFICLYGISFDRPVIAFNPDTFDVTFSCSDSVTLPLEICNNSAGSTDLIFSLTAGNQFYEDFENGLGKWVKSGGNWGTVNFPYQGLYSLTESPVGNYTNGQNNTITLIAPLTVTDPANCRWDFRLNRSMECCCDWLRPQISVNGGAWVTLTSWNCNEGWSLKSFNLSSYVTNGDQLSIRYWFTSDGSVVGNGVHIDEVLVTGASQEPWLSLSNFQDTVAAGDCDTVWVTLNSAGLNNGLYTSEIYIASNDPLSSPDTVQVVLNVLGAPIIGLSDTCTTLDSAMAYRSSSDTVMVYNTGCDTLFLSNLFTNLPEFSVSPAVDTVLLGDSIEIFVTFSPTAPGIYNDTVFIINNDVDTFFCISAQAYPRPVISFMPDSLIATLAACCDSADVTWKIFNTGGSDLTWDASQLTASTDDFDPGIDWALWNDIIGGAPGTGCGAISGNALYFNGSGTRWAITRPLDVTFGGTITFNLRIGTAGSPCENADAGEDVILYYSTNGGTSWTNIATYNVDGYAGFPQVVQPIPAGAYGPSTMFRWFQPSHSGSVDNWSIDNVNITVSSPFLSIIPPLDTVAPGDSSEVTVRFNSCGLNAGTYYANVVLNSNDPLNTVDTVPVVFTFTGTPIIGVSDTCLDLDSIMEFTTHTDSLYVRNDGCDSLFVTNITTAPSEFTVSMTTDTIMPGDSSLVIVTFAPTAPGTYNGSLTVFNNDQDTVICLTGDAFLKPMISLDKDTISISLTSCCDSISDTITIYNTGGSDLYYNVGGAYAVFDGSGDYISRAGAVNLPTGSVITAEALVHPKGYADVSYNGIVSYGPRGCTGTSFLMSLRNDGGPSMATWCNDNVPAPPPGVTLNEWSHVACVVNGTSVRFYVNGVEKTGTIGTWNITAPQNLSIGSTDFPGRYFNGYIDEVRIWNTARTQAEILANMNRTLTGNEAGLRGYWNFDGFNAADVSGNGNTGTVNGNTAFVQGLSSLPSWLTVGGALIDTIAPGDSVKLPVIITSCGLDTGFHLADIPVYSNDPLNSPLSAHISLYVAPLPSPPAAPDQTVCTGNPTPDLTATGQNIQWYDDAGLTNLVATGSPFATGQTAVGVYTYWVTQTIDGCEGTADSVNLFINNGPGGPPGTSPDTAVCFGETNLQMTATGDIVQWYTDAALTNRVNTGLTYTTPQTAVGVYKYFLTDSTGGCTASAADSIRYEIRPIPAPPSANDTSICFGFPAPPLIRTTGDSIHWYTDPGLTNLVHIGDTFFSPETVVGTHRYYITQKGAVVGCESTWSTADLVINPAPNKPNVADTAICFGEATPTFTATGTNIRWYDDSLQTVLLQSGTSFSPGETAVGVYVYWVTDSAGGCTTPVDKAVLTIYAIPAAPVAGDAGACFGDAVPDLSSTGSNVRWYNDAGLSNLVYSGNPFPTGQTAAGTYTYYATQTVNGCESAGDAATLTIIALPATPSATDRVVCSGNPTPDLTSTGTNVKWYDDAAMTNLVNTGNTYSTGETAVGTYTYYVTDSANGCESIPDTAVLSINPAPGTPAASDATICFGDATPDLTSTGTIVQWYDDAAMTNKVHTGNIFTTGITAPGVYTFYVTDSTGGCPASLPPDTAVLTIYVLPAQRSGNDTVICFGDATPDLIASGDSIRWYDDGALTNLVHNGDTFATGETAVGIYTYYVTETDTATNCEGPADTVVLNISAIPSAPAASGQQSCFGDATPDLTATGTSLRWYDDAGLTNLVATGSPFATGQTAVGTYTYYVTQSIGPNCESASTTVTLDIYAIPAAPVTSDQQACFNTVIPDLSAAGANIAWYDDAGLSNQVGTGSPFPTGRTAVGSYKYYVTQTVNGCESPADSAVLTIIGLPSAPESADTTICFSSPTPDLTATGNDIKWYDDAGLTSQVGAGSPFATGQTAVGVYTYYVTQTDAGTGCTSPSTTVVLTINAAPGAPASSDTTICSADPTPDLIATGTYVRWYDDAGLTNLVHTNDTFPTGQTAPGVYIYYVTDSVGACPESPATTVTLTINATPAAPTAANQEACFGDAVPDLTSTGTSVQWYDDGALTNLVNAGSTFSTGETAVGTYTYYVTQTVSGCESPADTVTLTIHPIPPSPAASSPTICFGDATPGLIATTGVSIQWYDDAGLTNLVHSNDTFPTGQTAAGTYTYYVTQTANNCESPATTVTLTINAIPAVPVSADTSACFGDPTPILTATPDNNVRWYDDVGLTNLVASGDTFLSSVTLPGSYAYFVTQTVNGCESAPTYDTLFIYATPTPSATDTAICFGDATPDLTSTGTDVKWYDDAGLTNLVATGSPFATGQTAAGVYTWYVTNTENACPSVPDTSVLTISPAPAPPATGDTTVCEGDPVPDLTAAGTFVRWYDDAGLSNLVFTGDTFATGQTTPGSYVYYVTDSVAGCTETAANTATLTINATPAMPAAGDTSTCFGDPVPDLASTGSNVRWYDDGGLTNQVNTGNIYSTGQTAVGAYTYYVTQTINNCESPADTVTLTINAAPAAPTAPNRTSCFGDPVPDLTATGTIPKWYDDAGLTNLVFTGDTFATGQTAAGVYTYYVVDSVPGCSSGPSATVTLTINAIPAAPAAADTAVCAGSPVPDLIASGTSVRWYDDAELTSLVFSGDTFATGQTAPGLYPYYVTQTIAGCESPADTVLLAINAIPAAPASQDTAICSGNPTPDLTATGTNVRWYDDAGLTSLVGTGNTFSSGQTGIGSYVYYVTQSVNNCASPSTTVTLTIDSTPPAPLAADTAICFGAATPDLTATGTNVRWYDDAGLTNLVFSGDTFATGQTAAGTYVYYLTQTAGTCAGPADTATLSIYFSPAPTALDTVVCAGGPVPDLTSTGSGVTWYDDAGLTNIVGAGNTFASGQTAIGTYTYYVTQTVNGCESQADTSVLSIISSSPPPVVSSPNVCEGDTVPDLTATGSIIQWYTDSALTNRVFSGNVFPTGQTTAGVYIFYVMDSVPGCESAVVTSTLTINAVPTAPVTSDTTACDGSPNPPFTATGSNVQWYSDAGLTAVAGTGNSFTAPDAAPGVYTYYVTQTVNGCESTADSATLTIFALPAAPTASDTAVCAGDAVPDLTATGTGLLWFDDGGLTNQVGSGNTYTTGQTAAGTYSYYVAASANGCLGPADTAILTIYAIPAAPPAANRTACQGSPVPDLTAGGQNIRWYSDSALTTLVFSGDTFATGNTALGTYTYFVTQTVNGCTSPARQVTLSIVTTPAAPAAQNRTGCAGSPIPDLTASGNLLQWYDDAGLTNRVFTGSPFPTGQTAPGVYTYYVTDSLPGCVSPATMVTLTVNAPPTAPAGLDVTICYGTPTPPLTAVGSGTIRWYSDPELIVLVGTGNSFVTGRTKAGIYKYYITDNVTACAESTSDTVTLTINPTPLVTLNTYNTTINQGDSATLIAYNASGYTWSPATGLSATSGAMVKASPSVTTTYIVTGTNAYGCTDTASVKVNVNFVGLYDHDAFRNLRIYPNPNLGTFTVDFTYSGDDAVTVTVFNTLGQVILADTPEGDNGNYRRTFSLQQPPGLYYVQIATGKHLLSRKVLVR